MIPIGYYLFAFFVFILVCALLFIYKRFIAQPRAKSPVAPGEENAAEKDERIFKFYQILDEMMNNLETYNADARELVESVKRQMQQQSDGINELTKWAEATEAGARAAVAALKACEKPKQKKEEETVTNSNPPSEAVKRNTKHEDVKELLGNGLTVEQIAQKLELSINEVRLIVYGLMTKNIENSNSA